MDPNEWLLNGMANKRKRNKIDDEACSKMNQNEDDQQLF